MTQAGGEQTKGNIIFTILGWVIGVFLILMGLAGLSIVFDQQEGGNGNILLSIGLLLSGAILVPPIIQKLRKKVPTLKIPFWPPLLSFLIVMSFSILGVTISPPKTSKRNVPESVIASKSSSVSTDENDISAKKKEQNEEIKIQLKNLNEQIISIASDCDYNYEQLTTGMGNGRLDRFSAYEIAKNTGYICNSAYFAFTKLKPPTGLQYEEKEKIKTALQGCELAYINKQSAAEKIAKALDKGVSPSIVSEVKSLGKDSQLGQLSCIAGVMSVSAARGVEFSDKKSDSSNK